MTADKNVFVNTQTFEYLLYSFTKYVNISQIQFTFYLNRYIIWLFIIHTACWYSQINAHDFTYIISLALNLEYI